MEQMVFLKVACCTSGLCISCHRRGNHGDKSARKWENWSDEPIPQSKAEQIAKNWSSYDPYIVLAI